MESTRPNPVWDPEGHSETVNTLASLRGEVTIHIWCADWCRDCRAALPNFFAALHAAGLDGDEVEVHEVDREKRGEGTDEYEVTLIPTIVVERGDEELARFEESEALPAADYLAEKLHDSAAKV